MAPVAGEGRLARAPPPIVRFGLLGLTTFIAFSGYYSYDLPGICFEELKGSMHKSNEDLGIVFSLYALPNAVVPLLAGVAYHRLGVWRGLIGISCIIATGIAIIAVAVRLRIFWLFLLGRFVYGFVGESMLVGVDVLVSDWFRFAELGLAMGLVQGIAQAGSFCAFYGVPPLLDALGDLAAPFFVALAMAVAAVVFLIVAMLWERAALKSAEVAAAQTRLLRQQERAKAKAAALADSAGESALSDLGVNAEGAVDGDDEGEEGTEDEDGGGDEADDDDADVDASQNAEWDGESDADDNDRDSDSEVQDAAPAAPSKATGEQEAADTGSLTSPIKRLRGGRSPASTAAAAAAAPDAADSTPSSSSQGEALARESKGSRGEDRAQLLYRGKPRRRGCLQGCLRSPPSRFLGLHHLAYLPVEFFCVFAGIASYSSVFYTYLAFGNDLFISLFGMNSSQSGRVVGLVSIASAVFSPLSGLLLDKVGGRQLAAFVCMCATLAGFALLGFSRVPYLVPVALTAMSYAVLPSALYPLITDTVPPRAFTQVYALVNAAINSLLVVSFYSAGKISDTNVAEADGGGDANGGGGDGGSGGTQSSYRAGHYTGVFFIFLALSAMGVVATGMLAYRHSRGWLQQLWARGMRGEEGRADEEEVEAADEVEGTAEGAQSTALLPQEAAPLSAVEADGALTRRIIASPTLVGPAAQASPAVPLPLDLMARSPVAMRPTGSLNMLLARRQPAAGLPGESAAGAAALPPPQRQRGRGAVPIPIPGTQAAAATEAVPPAREGLELALRGLSAPTAIDWAHYSAALGTAGDAAAASSRPPPAGGISWDSGAQHAWVQGQASGHLRRAHSATRRPHPASSQAADSAELRRRGVSASPEARHGSVVAATHWTGGAGSVKRGGLEEQALRGSAAAAVSSDRGRAAAGWGVHRVFAPGLKAVAPAATQASGAGRAAGLSSSWGAAADGSRAVAGSVAISMPGAPSRLPPHPAGARSAGRPGIAGGGAVPEPPRRGRLGTAPGVTSQRPPAWSRVYAAGGFRGGAAVITHVAALTQQQLQQRARHQPGSEHGHAWGSPGSVFRGRQRVADVGGAGSRSHSASRASGPQISRSLGGYFASGGAGGVGGLDAGRASGGDASGDATVQPGLLRERSVSASLLLSLAPEATVQPERGPASRTEVLPGRESEASQLLSSSAPASRLGWQADSMPPLENSGGAASPSLAPGEPEQSRCRSSVDGLPALRSPARGGDSWGARSLLNGMADQPQADTSAELASSWTGAHSPAAAAAAARGGDGRPAFGPATPSGASRGAVALRSASGMRGRLSVPPVASELTSLLAASRTPSRGGSRAANTPMDPRGASFEEEELPRGETIGLQLHAPASGGLLLSPTVTPVHAPLTGLAADYVALEDMPAEPASEPHNDDARAAHSNRREGDAGSGV